MASIFSLSQILKIKIKTYYNYILSNIDSENFEEKRQTYC